MSGRRIGMLFGGRSVEHEVSVDSARSVATALTAAGFELVPIGVTGEGRWLAPEASARVLAGDAVRVEDDTERESVRAALLAKYEVEASDDGHEDKAWIFRLEPR